MRSEANNASCHMELKNQDFETQVDTNEEISKFEAVAEKSTLVN